MSFFANGQFKCPNSTNGCTWTGSVRDFVAHQGACKHAIKNCSSLLDELCKRMDKCERNLMEKDEAIALLKSNLQEVTVKFNEKFVEVAFIKNENKNLHSDLEEIKNQNMELKQLELKMEDVLLKNTMLEQKVVSLEDQSLDAREKVENNKTELETTKGDVHNVKNMSESQVLEITVLKDKLEDMEKNLAGKSEIQSVDMLKELRAAINNDFRKLKDELSGKSLEGDVLIKNGNKNLHDDLKEKVELKMENLLLKNTILEQKFLSLENQSLHTREKLGELSTAREDIHRVRNMTENQVLEITAIKDKLKDMEKKLTEESEMQSVDTRSAVNDDFKDLEKQLNEKFLEVDFMKYEHKNLRDDMKDLKNQSMELKQVELKMENMLLKNTILEQKVLSLENQSLHKF